jgi:hypothetical protein
MAYPNRPDASSKFKITKASRGVMGVSEVKRGVETNKKGGPKAA